MFSVVSVCLFSGEGRLCTGTRPGHCTFKLVCYEARTFRKLWVDIRLTTLLIPSGNHGNLCQYNVDMCRHSNPCRNETVCIDGPVGYEYSCFCKLGWTFNWWVPLVVLVKLEFRATVKLPFYGHFLRRTTHYYGKNTWGHVPLNHV